MDADGFNEDYERLVGAGLAELGAVASLLAATAPPPSITHAPPARQAGATDQSPDCNGLVPHDAPQRHATTA